MMNRNILNPMMWTTGSGPTPPTPVDAGIYWSSSLGLISLSEDGENWITIADKNLGASQVYNDGDTLSEANCGKYYQWGNNYGFPWEGDVSTISTQVDASNYGPYYESDTFITGLNQQDTNRSSVSNNNLRGSVTDTLEARRGPCNEGYHVPYRNEMLYLLRNLRDLGLDMHDGNDIRIYLKMPFSGTRSGVSSNVIEIGTSGHYRLSDIFEEGFARDLYLTNNFFSYNTGFGYCNGVSIRPFKNTPVIPTSSWVTLFDGGNGYGIFWSPEEGLISIIGEYRKNWITIADKNLGATVVYINGDELSEANCGKFYQRGNNYGFPRSGEVTSTQTKVNATNYGPYYYHNEFKTGYYPWTSVKNPNLWGDITNTNKARRGPCNEGYHVPSNNELGDLRDIMGHLGIVQNANVYLKLPYAGLRSYTDGQKQGQGTSATIPGTKMHGSNSVFGTTFSSNSYNWTNIQLSEGVSIRPFKNEPVVPDNSWIKIY